MRDGAKIIVTLIILVVIALIGFFIYKAVEKKPVETIVVDPYEYFTLNNKDQKVGVINREGKIIIEPKYMSVYIPNQSKDVFVCFTDENTYEILDKSGKDIFTNFESVYPIPVSDTTLEMEKQVLSYEEDGKYGLIDYTGKKVTSAIYDSVSSLKNKPGCIQVKKDGLYGVVDSNGTTIIEPKYNSVRGDEYSSEKDGYLKTGYIISEKTKTGIIYGYIDYEGRMLIEPEYESITRCLEYEDDEVYLVFMQNGKKGVIKDSKIIIKPRFQSVVYYDVSNIFIVCKNKKYGFYNSEGDEILKPNYPSYSVAGNYISVKDDKGDMILYDIHGNIVNTNTYKSITETNNPSYFIAQDENGYYSIISKDFQIGNKYTSLTYAFDNFFIVTTEDNLYGVIDVYAGLEIAPEYDVIIPLENVHALEARKGTTVDIYSEKIEKILTMENAVVEAVGEEYISIYSKNELKYINKVGEIVPNTEVYKDLKLYSYQADDGKWGYADKDGNIVVDCKYDVVTELNEYGFAGIFQENKWGVIDEKGNVVVVPTYEIETYYSPSFVGKYLLEEVETVYCTEISEDAPTFINQSSSTSTVVQTPIPDLKNENTDEEE